MPVTMRDLELLDIALRRSSATSNSAGAYYGATADMLKEIKSLNNDPEVIVELLMRSVINAPEHIDSGNERLLAKIHCSAIADFLAEFRERCPL